jgi:hypothetical protein
MLYTQIDHKIRLGRYQCRVREKMHLCLIEGDEQVVAIVGKQVAAQLTYVKVERGLLIYKREFGDSGGDHRIHVYTNVAKPENMAKSGLCHTLSPWKNKV